MTNADLKRRRWERRRARQRLRTAWVSFAAAAECSRWAYPMADKALQLAFPEFYRPGADFAVFAPPGRQPVVVIVDPQHPPMVLTRNGRLETVKAMPFPPPPDCSISRELEAIREKIDTVFWAEPHAMIRKMQ